MPVYFKSIVMSSYGKNGGELGVSINFGGGGKLSAYYARPLAL